MLIGEPRHQALAPSLVAMFSVPTVADTSPSASPAKTRSRTYNDQKYGTSARENRFNVDYSLARVNSGKYLETALMHISILFNSLKICYLNGERIYELSLSFLQRPK